VNQVTPASLRYPLSVFNKNSTLKRTKHSIAVLGLLGSVRFFRELEKWACSRNYLKLDCGKSRLSRLGVCVHHPITAHHSYAFLTAWGGYWGGGNNKRNQIMKKVDSQWWRPAGDEKSRDEIGYNHRQFSSVQSYLFSCPIGVWARTLEMPVPSKFSNNQIASFPLVDLTHWRFQFVKWPLFNLSNRHFELSTIWRIESFNLSNCDFSICPIDKVTFWSFMDVTQWNFQGVKVVNFHFL